MSHYATQKHIICTKQNGKDKISFSYRFVPPRYAYVKNIASCPYAQELRKRICQKRHFIFAEAALWQAKCNNIKWPWIASLILSLIILHTQD